MFCVCPCAATSHARALVNHDGCFDWQVQDIQAATKLDLELTMALPTAINSASKMCMDRAIEAENSVENRRKLLSREKSRAKSAVSASRVYRAAHAICKEAVWTATIMPLSYSAALKEENPGIDMEARGTAHIGDAAVRTIANWEAGRTDVSLEYQVSCPTFFFCIALMLCPD